ncbi:MAG: HlyD family efflux transporter periplasmic adaptor subunit [Rhodanobacteraceae bacterium]
MNRPCRAFAHLALAAFLTALAACTGGEQAASPAAPASNAAQSPWLAIARGQVDVEGGLVRVGVTRDGVISSVEVQQGDRVEAGQMLAQLDPRAARIDMAGQQAQAEEARAQLAEIDVKLREAKRRAPRLAAAARAGAATGDAADEARNAVAALQAQRDAAQAALDAARQRVGAARFDLDARSLRAPVAGTVARRDAQIGQTVSASSGTPLFELLPDRPRIVRAQLDADDADKIASGMRAQIVRDSGAGPTYMAKVLRVGEVLGSATLSEDPLQRAASREVDCVLLLEPSNDSGTSMSKLRIGQRVLVRFPR